MYSINTRSGVNCFPDELFLEKGSCQNSNTTGMCLALCLGGLVLYMVMQSNNKYAYYAQMPLNGAQRVAGMVAASAIEAKETLTGSGMVNDKPPEIKGDGPVPSNISSLPPKTSDEGKEQNAELLKKFVNDNCPCNVMIFAPWCQHCHQQAPAFMEAARSVPSKQFVMANGDTLPMPFLEVMQIKAFPSFLQCTDKNIVNAKPISLSELSQSPSTQKDEKEDAGPTGGDWSDAWNS